MVNFRKDVITMVCATVKEGVECTFMEKGGCQFNGGSCHAVVEQCDGCQRMVEVPTGNFCAMFPEPSAKWRLGTCNMATHVKAENGNKGNKINPLKASKRGH